MNLDITQLLNDWDYDPNNHIRILKLSDGREVLQVRQPLGIEQYEMDGRPDGKLPFNKESVLQEYLERLKYHKLIFSSDESFLLDHEDFIKLQEEGMLYYCRYLILYQIGDFERTSRDTDHNLKICELIDKYLKDVDEKNELLQYRPYILRMNAISKAMIKIQNKLKYAAREILRSTIEVIKNIPEIDTPTFQLEKTRSIETLKTTLLEISSEGLKEIEALENQLASAIEKEEYEKAAKLRDKINSLMKKQEKTRETD